MNKRDAVQITKDKFISTLKSDEVVGSITHAALMTGISRQTIYNWRKDDAEFDNAVMEAVTDGKIRIADLAEIHLVKKIKAGDTTAIIFTLKTLRSVKYGEKDERKEEEKINQSKKDSHPKSPGQALAQVCMYLRYFKSIDKDNLNSPELQEMYEKLETITDSYKDVLR